MWGLTASVSPTPGQDPPYRRPAHEEAQDRRDEHDLGGRQLDRHRARVVLRAEGRIHPVSGDDPNHLLFQGGDGMMLPVYAAVANLANHTQRPVLCADVADAVSELVGRGAVLTWSSPATSKWPSTCSPRRSAARPGSRPGWRHDPACPAWIGPRSGNRGGGALRDCFSVSRGKQECGFDVFR